MNKRHRAFAERYFCTDNAAEAARFVGISEKRARITGNDWLNRDDVKEYLDQLRKEQAKRLNADVNRVTMEMAKLGFHNAQDAVDENGNFLPLHKLPRDVAAAVQHVSKREVTDKEGNTTTVWDYKFAKKQDSLTKLGEKLKLFTQMVEVKGSKDLVDALTAARKRTERNAGD